jgi:hypothetical protein
VIKLQANGKLTSLFTGPANAKQIHNLLSQFPCSLLSPANVEHFHSLLSHVTAVYPLGKPQANSQFTE